LPFLQRARYERTPKARGSRNGVRSRRIQTAEGQPEVAIPQLRNCAERLVPKVIPDTRIRAIEELWPDADRQRCAVHYADLRIMPTWLGKPWLEAGNGLARSA
jgi:transposase-like protein